MTSAILPELPQGGFSFENFQRNEFLALKGFPMPKARKTGTTIAGIVFKDGIILGADTRATEGDIVADKNCSKIHFLAQNIYCCGAGTAADTEMVNKMISSQLELHRLSTGKTNRVCVANRMLRQYLFRYQGHVGAALVLGGVDVTGAHLYSIYPHGSTDNLPYVTMGSGSLAAMSVFESRWRPEMPLEDGKKLVRDAIAAGIFNDLGSGSNVDLCIITKPDAEAEYIRPYDKASTRIERPGRSYRYKRGATAILSTQVIPLEVDEVMVRQIESEDAMDTSS
jgi:20S proteasome subunit beta 2